MAIAEAPRGATIDPEKPVAFLAPLNRRNRKHLKKEERKLRRQERVANRLQTINEQSFPHEQESLAWYKMFEERVRNSDDEAPQDKGRLLEDGVLFSTLWNNDPPYVHRRVETQLREAARDAGRDPGKLPRHKFSSLEACLDIISQGTIPTNPHEAEGRIRDVENPETREKLITLHNQLLLNEKTKGRHGSGAVLELGASLGIGASGGALNIGIEAESKDTQTGRRKYDVFVAPSEKFVAPGATEVIGARKRGVEKFVTLFGLTLSKDHPHRGDQVKVKPTLPLLPSAGIAAGEKSGFTVDTPIVYLSPLLSAIGMDELASSIQALGPAAYFVRSQVILNFQDERLRPVQDKFARLSARMPQVRLRRNKKRGLPVEETIASLEDIAA